MNLRLAPFTILLPALAAVAVAGPLVDPAVLPAWPWLSVCAGLVLLLAPGVYLLKRAVVLRRRAEEAYLALFDDAADAISITTPALDFLEVNQRACELLGYAREELLSKNLRELLPAEDRAGRPLDFSELIGTNRTEVRERRLVRKDGGVITVEVSVRALRDGRLVSIARDVTERRAAEEALKANEALNRSVVYTAVDGIVTADENGVVLSFNPAAERLFGYTAEEVIGRNLSILMPSPHREEHDAHIRRYLETGVRKIIGIGREVTALRKDGTTFPADLAVSEMLLPGRRLFTGILHDLTARKRVESMLRETNATLQAVIETSPLAVITIDLEGTVLAWNAAAERIFGWSAAEVLGKPIPTMPDEERAEIVRSSARKARSEMPVGVERRRRRKDGSAVDVSVWTALLPGPADELSAILVIAADVTQRKAIEEQLRQAHKMEAVSRLAGGVAHDFNNLLTIIGGYGQMALDRASGDPELKGHLEQVLKAAEQASALASQLLLFGRHRPSAVEDLDLAGLVRKLEPALRRIIGEDIALTIAAREDAAPVRAAASQIEQVLLNLVGNARDAMPSGGNLAIEIANVELGPWYTQNHMNVEEGGYVMLAVSDTGMGIPAEARARLFEPFFTTKDRSKGAGLGLSTVYGIVRQCGGHIWVYSEPGEGASFKVYLPRAEHPVPRPQAEPEKPAPRSGAETVLLVEDEPGIRALVREILRQNGYSVLEADDVEHALRLCREHDGGIQLLLTDVVMPGMSGRELAEQAASLRPDLKVLYMSGYTDNIVVHHGVDARDTGFLQKPFTPGVLARKVRDILDRP
ncbi:MAG TPA: PAS domain S-box protein [Bryobacteraceae bacterium]